MKNLHALLNTPPSLVTETSEIQHLRETLARFYETMAMLIREHDAKQAEWDRVAASYPDNEPYRVYMKLLVGKEITNLAKSIVRTEVEIADLRKELGRVTDSYQDQATWD